jgi:anti-sigma regulatory factor (Ser/Thr protein kinase)
MPGPEVAVRSEDPHAAPERPRHSVGDLHLIAVPALAEQLSAVRRAVTDWVRALSGSKDLEDDVGLAVYEALANVADHAYGVAGDGVFDLHAVHGEGMLTVTVADQGRWKPEAARGSSLRGRGLVMIERLAAEFEVRRQAGGTQVLMRWPCPAIG